MRTVMDVDSWSVTPYYKMKPGGIIYVMIALIGLFFLYKLADMFSPGSYGHAELYELSYPEKKVIDAINKLKNSDAELRVPKVTIKNNGQFDLNDGKEKSTNHWYTIYFYDKTNNQILLTRTRPSGSNTTTFALVSINSGLDLGHWKDVNDDLGFFENREIKRNFEVTILERVERNLEQGL